ncbi:MAG: histidine phosphatase family protein [Ahrensia sp.]|nr:histidine phosphatase family protein [Ahrensia sp.]
MKRLFILRHAKSSWAQPGLQDIDRPLNGRGNKQIAALASWFSGRAHKPELALCSPARRTRETWGGIEHALTDTRMEVCDALYDSDPDTYLDALRPREVNSIMLVGHNPTCDELARYLTAPSSPKADELFRAHYGTCNLAVLELDVDDWSAISGASGQLVTMLRPRDLNV